MESYLEFCRKSVQGYDSDRYLASLFARDPSALWAVFAFHHEIAKTRFVVSEPTLGLIRLQWWRDEIDKIYAGVAYAGGEVLSALAEAIKAHDLPHDLFEALIAVREIELRGEQPDGVDGAMAFFEMMQIPLVSLAVYVDGGSVQQEPLSVIALNYGIMDALRRADAKSLVGQNRAVFEEAFVFGVKPECKVLRAIQAVSEIWMRHLKRQKSGQPACLALRVWTHVVFS
jgi:phytoene synthase